MNRLLTLVVLSVLPAFACAMETTLDRPTTEEDIRKTQHEVDKATCDDFYNDIKQMNCKKACDGDGDCGFGEMCDTGGGTCEGCCVKKPPALDEDQNYCRWIIKPCVEESGGECECPDVDDLKVPNAHGGQYFGEVCDADHDIGITECPDNAAEINGNILDQNCMCPYDGDPPGGCSGAECHRKFCSYRIKLKPKDAGVTCCRPSDPDCDAIPHNYCTSERGGRSCAGKEIVGCKTADNDGDGFQDFDIEVCGPDECVILDPPESP